MQLYAEVNRIIIPRWHALLNIEDPERFPMVDPKLELFDPKNRKKQIGHDSMVDVGCKFGDKVSIKRAIIGGHCTLGDRVVVSDTVVMGHVTIGPECK
jgi:NDP-sugar pyrophosphorylase family protein